MRNRNLTDDMDDEQYIQELFNHVRSYLTLEETIELIAGRDTLIDQTGIEALENWALCGIDEAIDGQMRPPTATPSAYADSFIRMIGELPDRLMERAFWAEIERMDSGFSSDQSQLWGQIELYCAGERVFQVDFTDEILEVAEHLEESEAKIDLLEVRGAISGREWADRTDSLEA